MQIAAITTKEHTSHEVENMQMNGQNSYN